MSYRIMRFDGKGQPVPQNPAKPDGKEDPGSKTEAARADVISSEGGKYVLRSHKGKVLGKHPSRAAAEKQESAINIAKARKAGHKIPKKDETDLGAAFHEDDHFRLAERAKMRGEAFSDMTTSEGRHANSGNNCAEPEDCLCCIKNCCMCCGGGMCGCAGTCDCVDSTGVCDCPEAMHQNPNTLDTPVPVVRDPQPEVKKDCARYDLGAPLEKPEFLGNGWVRADGFLTRTGVFHYRQADGSTRREFRPPNEVFNQDALRSFAMVPLTNEHPAHGLLDAENTKLYQVGTVEAPRKDGEKVRSHILVTDSDAVASMKRGRQFLSCGYTCDLEFSPGEIDGERYDCIQRNIKGNHVALVDEGRAGPDVRLRVDSADAQMLPFETSLTGKQPTEPKNMKKIRIDGVDYEVSEQAAQAIENLSARATASLKKESARADAAEAALEKAKKDLAEAPAKFQADREARKAVKTDARKILGADASFEGKSTEEIKRMAIEATGVKLDGKDATYVDVAFDYAVQHADGAKDKTSLFPKQDTTRALTTRTDGAPVKTIDEVREDAKRRSRDAYKVKADRADAK